MTIQHYPIGIPGVPWAEAERKAWFGEQAVARSYRDDVVDRLEQLRVIDASIVLHHYGELSIDPQRYPLLAAVLKSTEPDAPWALLTGGVHGYETSGVHGALDFLAADAAGYLDRVNLVVVPCVSPWGYEVINRWNPDCVDPNRSFGPDSESQEAAALMRFVEGLSVSFLMHLDLHETTDSDESEFRPALAARDGKPFEPGTIPDGFYMVADSANPQPGFHAAIIDAVSAVTHIAPADADGTIIGTPVVDRGVINYDFGPLGLCASMTEAAFAGTTEVYPDSASATPEICNAAQRVAARAGLDYALGSR